jgi:Trk-type K+ transport system membrane component
MGLCLAVTVLLFLPIATTAGQSPPFMTAFFTAVSAVSVVGLEVVDTGLFWSNFGQVVIMIAMVVGGLGIMTAASILGLVVSRRLGLTQRLLMASETKIGRLGDVRALVRVVVITALACQLAIAALLFPRFVALYGEPFTAAWHALFFGVSAFNNAGFVPTPYGLLPYGGDWFIAMPLIVGVFVGSLGFPVILNVISVQKGKLRHWRDWSLHTKLTVIGSLGLGLIGFTAFLLFEHSNPETLAGMGFGEQMIASLFAAVMPRSAGFYLVPPRDYMPATRLVTDVLMFIGGGSAGTAGGIKVTTLLVLLLAIRAEARGDRDIEVFHRRVPGEAVRVAVGVLMVGALIVLAGTMALLIISNAPLDVAIFEALSAFATVGLSTGLAPSLGTDGQIVLIILMFVGRIGSMTIASALALRDRQRVVRYPEERPIIG